MPHRSSSVAAGTAVYARQQRALVSQQCHIQLPEQCSGGQMSPSDVVETSPSALPVWPSHDRAASSSPYDGRPGLASQGSGSSRLEIMPPDVIAGWFRRQLGGALGRSRLVESFARWNRCEGDLLGPRVRELAQRRVN